MIWLLIDPKGIPAEPAYNQQSDAIKAAETRNTSLCESSDGCYIHGKYWRVRSCAMDAAPSDEVI